MNRIKTLLQNEKTREMIAYLVFGGLTTLVNWLVYLAVTALFTPKGLQGEVPMLLSNIGQVLGWVVSVAFAYLTNRKFVFQSSADAHGGAWKQFWLFVSARLASLLLFDLLLFNGLLLLGMNDKWDKLLMNALVIVFNFVASKFVIFRKKER